MNMKLVMLVVSLVLMLGSMAYADPYVTATYSPLQSGYRLDFILHTDALNGSRGWGLTTTEITDLAAPFGWDAWTDERQTEWYPQSPDFYVPPNGVLSGSSGTFTTLPTQLYYFVRLTGPGIGTYDGTLTPIAVPEPSSLLALAGGLTGLGGLALRRRQ